MFQGILLLDLIEGKRKEDKPLREIKYEREVTNKIPTKSLSKDPVKTEAELGEEHADP